MARVNCLRRQNRKNFIVEIITENFAFFRRQIRVINDADGLFFQRRQNVLFPQHLSLFSQVSDAAADF